jgi:hypothetical protein
MLLHPKFHVLRFVLKRESLPSGRGWILDECNYQSTDGLSNPIAFLWPNGSPERDVKNVLDLQIPFIAESREVESISLEGNVQILMVDASRNIVSLSEIHMKENLIETLSPF